LAGLTANTEPDDDPSNREFRSLVHEEVLRLPHKYRSPVILCYYEDLTHEEAARKLAWPKGTIAGRLARARKLLGKRLARRGVALALALTAVSAKSLQASTAIRAALVQMAFRNCLLVAGGEATAGKISAHVAALSKGVLQEMFWSKTKVIAALVLSVGLVAGGIGLLSGKQPTGKAETTVKNDARIQDNKVADSEGSQTDANRDRPEPKGHRHCDACIS
jgi:hypothetical protein